MGPKKRGKKKDEAKEDTTVQEAEEDEADETEFHIALLEIRVKELETLNSGLKRKCEYLESQNIVYKDQLSETREEKNDLVTHLQRNLDEEKSNVKELEDRLFGVQQARTDEAKDYEKRLLKKDEEFTDMKFRLDKHILELTAKLTSLDDFRAQKEKLAAEREQLELNLESERKSFEDKFEELENTMIRSRERMKNDCVDMVTKMAEDVLKAGRLSLTATVKTAIEENIRLKEEMEKISNDSTKLREELSKFQESMREKRMTIEVLEEENALVHKKCLQFRKLVTDFAERQFYMDSRMDSYEAVLQELKELRESHEKCKTNYEDRGKELRKSLVKVRQRKTSRFTEQAGSPDSYQQESETLQKRYDRLQTVILNMAIAAKDLSEARDEQEYDYLKGKFWTVLFRLYETACELPQLSQDIRTQLVINLPKLTPYIKR